MKTLIVSALLLLMPVTGWTQTKQRPWEDYLNEMMTVEDAGEASWEETYELLCEREQHPLDINEATREQLEELTFLSAQQVEEIMEYLYRNGPMKSLNELTMIRSLDPDRRRLLGYFVRVNGTVGNSNYKELFADAKVIEKDGIAGEFAFVTGRMTEGEFLKKYDYTDEWMDYYKSRGYKIYILSNFSGKAFRDCADELDYVKKADGAVISYQVGLIKPDPAIYRLLLDKYDIDPKEAVFIDDNKDNIEAAKQFGLSTILFTSREDADKKLYELGVR